MVKGYVGVTHTYTPVEYIESSGTQYIDTNFKHNQNTRMVGDMDFLNTSSQWSSPFGSWGGANASPKKMMGAEWTGSQISAYYGNGNSYSFGSQFGRKTWDFNKNVYKIGTTSYTFSSSTFQSEYNDFIFANSGYSGTAGGFSKMKLYSFQIYDNGTLVRNFIPVQDEEGVGCLFDTVDEKPYINKGTGNFTCGAPTGASSIAFQDKAYRITNGDVGVSTSYTPIEYLESSGTQYIDTGVIPTSTTKLEFDVTIIGGNSNVWMPIYGARSYSELNLATATYFCLYVQSSSQHLSPNYAGFDPGTSGNTTINFNQRYSLVQDKGQFYIDGVLATDISTTNSLTTGDKTIYLFNNNSVGLIQARGQDVKLYGCKIWDGGALVREFIPALDQDNIPCLFDLVEEKFYYNKGAGALATGSATGTTVVLGDFAKRVLAGYVGVKSTFTPVEYLQNSGTQYIDTGFIPNFTTGFKFELKVAPSVLGVRYNLINCFGNNSKFVYLEFTANNELRLGINGTVDVKQAGVVLGENTVSLEYSGALYKYTINGTSTSSFYVASGPMDGSLFLYVDRILRFSTFSNPLSIYYCRIFDGNTLVRSFVPAIDENGVACFYDKIEKRPYYNFGTGVFTAGNPTGVSNIEKSLARKCFDSYIVPKGATFLAHFENDCINAISGADAKANNYSNIYTFSTGKWGKAVTIKSTVINGGYNQSIEENSLRGGNSPNVYDVLTGAAEPITVSGWFKSNTNDGWILCYGYGYVGMTQGYYYRYFTCGPGITTSRWLFANEDDLL